MGWTLDCLDEIYFRIIQAKDITQICSEDTTKMKKVRQMSAVEVYQ